MEKMKRTRAVIACVALMAVLGAPWGSRAQADDEVGAAADQKSQLEERLDKLQAQLDQAEAKDLVGEQFLEMARADLMLARKALARGNERVAEELARECERLLAKATGSGESTGGGGGQGGDQPAEEVQP